MKEFKNFENIFAHMFQCRRSSQKYHDPNHPQRNIVSKIKRVVTSIVIKITGVKLKHDASTTCVSAGKIPNFFTSQCFILFIIVRTQFSQHLNIFRYVLSFIAWTRLPLFNNRKFRLLNFCRLNQTLVSQKFNHYN